MTNNIQAMRNRWGLTEPLPILDEHRKPGDAISTYHFAEVLGTILPDDYVLTTGCSGTGIETFQLSVPLSANRDIVCSWSLGSMGFGIPTAIGACIGSGRKNTICVDGDAGFHLNVQELETVRRLDLPIKFFVLNNNGMSSMRTSQQRWFGRSFGADEESGLTLPELWRIVTSYRLAYQKLDGWCGYNQQTSIASQIQQVLDYPGPIICEVPSPPNEQRPSQQQDSSGWSPVTRFRDDAAGYSI